MIICTIAIVLLFFLFWSIIRAGKDEVTVKLIESNIERPTYFIYALRGVMNWDRYLSTFTIPDKIQLIRQYVIENGIVGSPLNVTSNRCFLFSDGETLRFSDQGWIEFQKALTSESKYSKLRRDL
jgi:hypothetical protein